ncbi:MAG TPA: hypothetical protein VJT71_02255 [Pyrinomonadaceae bacterium]|nr:hypothetical protein [Pyrinomonadaceae bacterium]
MPWESIGSVDTGSVPGDENWIEFCQELALLYIKLVCPIPPAGVEVGIFAEDHDLGSYPTLGVSSEYSIPTKYVSACERALDTFNQAVDWRVLKEYFEESIESEDA